MLTPALNYTLQDLLGAIIGFVLFPLVIVFPGYCVGWWLDLFGFRQRLAIPKFTIALVLSFAVSPALLFLASRLASVRFALVLVAFFFIAFVIIRFRDGTLSLHGLRKYRLFLLAAGGWTLVAIFSLIDLQWDKQLYFTIVSYDLTTRVSIVDAITRTGVPPINPTFYPGHPVQLTFVYYFWYVLGSLIDILGGSWVDARAAQIASSAWCGLGLMAMIALYLWLRNPQEETNGRHGVSARLGIGLLAVSGLDAIPLVLMMLGLHALFADVEHWNSQITAWVGSLLWAPHHVAALVACLVAVLVILDSGSRPVKKWPPAVVLAGFAFASAIGMSVWVTVVFAVSWGIWMFTLLPRIKENRGQFLAMLGAGLLALGLASPFLLGIFAGNGNASAQFPLSLEVRPFYLLEPFVDPLPAFWRSAAMLAVLPLNYFLELGFYFLAGILWLRVVVRRGRPLGPYQRLEILLLAVVVVLASFLRSNLILNNDFGWRAWLPGQFVLLVWGVDVLQSYWSERETSPSGFPRSRLARRRLLLLAFLAIGTMTTAIEVFTLRFSSPLISGIRVGQSQYSARLAFDFLRDRVSSGLITQSNPLHLLDRPSGLYGTHQMAVADRTAYGVPTSQYEAVRDDVGTVFSGAASGWDSIDSVCLRYGIDVLIFQDSDPVWRELGSLGLQRPPLYENPNYRIFPCGEFARR